MNRLFKMLISKKTIALHRVAVINSSKNRQRIECTGALIFRFEPNMLFELIVGQASAQMISVSDERQILSDFELDEDEVCQLVDLEPEAVIYDPPFVVDSVTEWWAGPNDSKFLVGAVLWGAKRIPLVSIYTEGDDIELITFDKLKALITRISTDYKDIEELQY